MIRHNSRPIKPVKLFFIVFAAILAAGAILLSGIYAKARLDEWERAKWVYATQAATACAYAMAANDPSSMSSDASKAELRHTAIDREREYVSILENKPFGIPLTAGEQQDLKFVKANIAKLTDAEEADKNLAENVPSQQPETQPLPSQGWATLVQEVRIATPSGQVIALPSGTNLEFVSQEGSQIRIRYAGTEYLISAELAERGLSELP